MRATLNMLQVNSYQFTQPVGFKTKVKTHLTRLCSSKIMRGGFSGENLIGVSKVKYDSCVANISLM